MAISWASTPFSKLSIGTTEIARISIGDFVIWPEFAPFETVLVATGNYDIPAGCNKLDVILLGGGNGGRGGAGAFQVGGGGNAGEWAVATLVRGVDIPWSTKTLSITVPSAKPGGGNGQDPPNSDPAIASGTGWVGLSAPGGVGTKQGVTRWGQTPGDKTFNGRTYIGGAAQTSNEAAGNAPGGGGNGGSGGFVSGNSGGAGSRGQAWIYAY